MFHSWLVGLTSAAFACSGSDTDTDAADTDDGTPSERVEAWLGATPHLRLVGPIAGDPVDLDVGGADATDLAILFCERNYVGTDIEKFEVKHNFNYAGQPAELEITFEGPTAVGTYTIGTDAEVAFKIETADGTEYESGATSGTLEVALVTGTPDGSGLIPDNEGEFGAWIDLVLDDGALTASTTAGCGLNDAG